MPARAPRPLQPKICAWCDALMGVEVPRFESPELRANHGLCTECTEQLVESLQGAPASAPPEPLLPRHAPRALSRS